MLDFILGLYTGNKRGIVFGEITIDCSNGLSDTV